MITGVYSGLFGLLLLALSAQVIRERYRAKVAIGDGGDPKLQRVIRVHANFCEYVPLCLILIGLAEFGGAVSWAVHLLLAALFLGRVFHGFGVSQDDENLNIRRVGMILTFGVLVIASVLATLTHL